MKKLVLLLVFALTIGFVNAQQTVTINVDMSGVADFDPATRQLDWAGAIDGWAAFHPLTNSSGDIYSVTFTDVASGYYGGDVYHNDKDAPAWGTYGEWSGAPTGIDIMVYVGDEDVTINTKWGETYDLSVSVDMNSVEGFTAGTDSVFFLSPDVKIHNTPMLDTDADGVYTVTFNGIPSGHFPTIFAYGADRDNVTAEWNYATNKGGRVVVVEGANTDESFIFGEGGSGVAGYDVTINVDMADVAEFSQVSQSVYWAGNIDGWALHKMENTSEKIYSITFTELPSGTYLGDAYLNDKDDAAWGTYGEWSGGPTGIDVMIYVGDEDVAVNTKWGETYELSVSVNMNYTEEFTVGTDSVFFLSNDVGKLHNTPMVDEDGDGIYTVVFEGVPSGLFPTVFAYGSDRDNLTAEWNYSTNKGDRVIAVDGANTEVSYIFANEEPPVPGGNVTINVDMSDVSDFDPATRQLDWAGDFDGWAAFHTLSNTSGNIYSVTFNDIPSGYYAGDVYHNDKDAPAWGTYGEWSGSSTGIDIMVFVADEDVTINTKWGETYDLTVNVDMNNAEGFTSGSDNVYFKSEKMTTTQMLDDDGDGVYTATLTSIPSGQFPTVFGFGPDANTLTTEWDYDTQKGNRVILINGSDLNVTYVFGDATAIVGVLQRDLVPEISVYPNPVSGDIVTYSISTNDLNGGVARIIDLTGKVLIKREISSNTGNINTSELKQGLYFMQLNKGNIIATEKLIVE